MLPLGMSATPSERSELGESSASSLTTPTKSKPSLRQPPSSDWRFRPMGRGHRSLHGARAAEVGQLLPSDVTEQAGLLCIHMSDEGEHQKLKSDASIRTVPVHPDLLTLGFKEWVEGLRAAEAKRLFPAAKPDAKNGAGNWITKAFGRHLEAVGKNWTPGKRGFHSLRKTVIQSLQGAGVPSELRARWWDTSWTTSTTRRIAANSPPTRSCMGLERTPRDWRCWILA